MVADVMVDGGVIVGARLRQHRELAAMTITEVAQRSGMSRPKVSKVENGRVSPSTYTVQRIGTALGLTAAQIDDLVEQGSRSRGAADSHTATQREFMRHEQKAHRVRVYLASCLPAILQTNAYVDLIIGSAPLSLSYADEAEVFKQDRMLRRAVLYDRSKQFEFLIDKSTLDLRALGMSEFQTGLQLSYLAEAARLPNVDLRLMQLSMHLLMPRVNFAILDDRLVESESYYRSVYARDEPTVAETSKNYRSAQDAALSPRESLEYIERLMTPSDVVVVT